MQSDDIAFDVSPAIGQLNPDKFVFPFNVNGFNATLSQGISPAFWLLVMVGFHAVWFGNQSSDGDQTPSPPLRRSLGVRNKGHVQPGRLKLVDKDRQRPLRSAIGKVRGPVHTEGIPELAADRGTLEVIKERFTLKLAELINVNRLGLVGAFLRFPAVAVPEERFDLVGSIAEFVVRGLRELGRHAIDNAFARPVSEECSLSRGKSDDAH